MERLQCPPVQPQTYRFPASDSSVALASAQGGTVASLRPVCYGSQGGCLRLLRSDMARLRCLSGLRASVLVFLKFIVDLLRLFLKDQNCFHDLGLAYQKAIAAFAKARCTYL